MVESQPSKLLVAGSIPVSRSILPKRSLCSRLRMAGHSADVRSKHVAASREGAKQADLSA